MFELGFLTPINSDPTHCRRRHITHKNMCTGYDWLQDGEDA